MKLVLLGAPGSGKGTLSNVLVEKYGFSHISTGNLFRKEIDSEGPMAEQLKTIMASGRLVDDSITNILVKKEISDLIEQNKSFILDGYPRTNAQAEFLKTLVSIDAVIVLEISKDLALKRMIGRRTCNKCGKIYNIYFDPPKIENVCDRDNSVLVHRKDDEITICEKRFNVYNSQTKPLIDYYEEKKLIHRIDAVNLENVLEKTDKIIRANG